MVNRIAGDRRRAKPFGTNSPWFSIGKMGGLIFTERRVQSRRSIDPTGHTRLSDGEKLLVPGEYIVLPP